MTHGYMRVSLNLQFPIWHMLHVFLAGSSDTAASGTTPSCGTVLETDPVIAKARVSFT